jgi:hypothetical protein
LWWKRRRSSQDFYNHSGANSAVSDFSKRHEVLFFWQRIAGFRCHGSFNFSDEPASKNIAGREIEFHGTGLYGAVQPCRCRALRRSKGFSTLCGGRRIIGSGLTAGVGQAQSQPRRLIGVSDCHQQHRDRIVTL